MLQQADRYVLRDEHLRRNQKHCRCGRKRLNSATHRFHRHIGARTKTQRRHNWEKVCVSAVDESQRCDETSCGSEHRKNLETATVVQSQRTLRKCTCTGARNADDRRWRLSTRHLDASTRYLPIYCLPIAARPCSIKAVSSTKNVNEKKTVCNSTNRE